MEPDNAIAVFISDVIAKWCLREELSLREELILTGILFIFAAPFTFCFMLALRAVYFKIIDFFILLRRKNLRKKK